MIPELFITANAIIILLMLQFYLIIQIILIILQNRLGTISIIIFVSLGLLYPSNQHLRKTLKIL